MIEVQENYFTEQKTAEREIDASTLHKAEFAVPAVDGKAHWHRFDACLYLLEGTLHLTDVAAEKVLEIRPGCKVYIPEGTLHAERSAGYRVLLGASVPPDQFGNPVDIPPENR
jgi:mannose-6-phosphate isomerase-like protein (cupin superfamily)